MAHRHAEPPVVWGLFIVPPESGTFDRLQGRRSGGRVLQAVRAFPERFPIASRDSVRTPPIVCPVCWLSAGPIGDCVTCRYKIREADGLLQRWLVANQSASEVARGAGQMQSYWSVCGGCLIWLPLAAVPLARSVPFVSDRVLGVQVLGQRLAVLPLPPCECSLVSAFVFTVGSAGRPSLVIPPHNTVPFTACLNPKGLCA